MTRFLFAREAGKDLGGDGDVLPSFALGGAFDVIDKGEAGPGSGGEVSCGDGVGDGELGGDFLRPSGGGSDFTFHAELDGVVVVGATDAVSDAVFEEVGGFPRFFFDGADDEAGFIGVDTMDSNGSEERDECGGHANPRVSNPQFTRAW